MPINFNPETKIIEVRPFCFTISQASQGTTIVVVNETPSTLVPSSGYAVLAEEAANIHGGELTSGYDWSSQNQHFILVSEAGGPETITLDQDCADLDAVISQINSKLANALYPHSTYLETIKDTIPVAHLSLQSKSGYEGETYGFKLERGTPSSLDALQTLGLSPAALIGDSDTYQYLSLEGTTFGLASTLSQDYTSSFPVAIRKISYDVQDFYEESQQWNEEQTSMKYLIPMEAVGRFSLGGGVYSDIIYSLVNGWKLRFCPGNYQITIVGTIISSDGLSPIVLPYAGNVATNFKVGTKGVITSPTVSSSEQTSIAEKVWSHTKGSKVYSDAEIMKKIETGRWKIVNNQMLIYDEDGITILYRFDLKDKQGLGTEESPYERVPV